MNRLLSLALAIFGVAISDMVYVKFDEINVSYAIDGTKFDNMTSLYILNPNLDDKILVQSWFETQNETDFQLYDGRRVINAKDLKEEELFEHTLGLNMENNTNFQWTFMFRRVSSDEDLIESTVRDFVYLDDDREFFFHLTTENVTHFVTFVHTIGYEYPQMAVLPYVDASTPDCAIIVYPQGIPSEFGAYTYRLMTYRYQQPTNTKYARNAILSSAATVEIPPGCSAQITASRIENWNFNTTILQEVPIHEGFIMSQGYPNFDINPKNFQERRPIEITYEISEEWQGQNLTEFLINIVLFKPGTEWGLLEITVGDQQRNFTTSQSDLSFEGTGNKMMVIYKSSNDDGEMLVRFKAKTPIQSTTKQATTQTSTSVKPKPTTTAHTTTRSTTMPHSSTQLSCFESIFQSLILLCFFCSVQLMDGTSF